MTARATEAFLGDPQRFADGKALASYVGLIPRERSSGARQRLGALTKQGSPLLRFVSGEAGAHAARHHPDLQRFYRRKLVQKGLGKARVAVARKLGIRLWIMLRDQIDYQEFCRRGQKQSGAASRSFSCRDGRFSRPTSCSSGRDQRSRPGPRSNFVRSGFPSQPALTCTRDEGRLQHHATTLSDCHRTRALAWKIVREGVRSRCGARGIVRCENAGTVRRRVASLPGWF